MSLKAALDRAREVADSTETNDNDYDEALRNLITAIETAATEAPLLNPDAPQPTIHMNGTGLRMLQDEADAAAMALQTAQEKLNEMTVHGRDFYVQVDPQALDKARAEHDRMRNYLHAVSNHIHLRREHLVDSETN